MPDLPVRPRRRLTTALERTERAIDWFLASAGSAGLVGALGILMWFLKVDWTYFLGAFLVIFASRLSQKRLYPEINVQEPRKTPVRDTFKPKDPFEGLTP